MRLPFFSRLMSFFSFHPCIILMLLVTHCSSFSSISLRSLPSSFSSPFPRTFLHCLSSPPLSMFLHLSFTLSLFALPLSSNLLNSVSPSSTFFSFSSPFLFSVSFSFSLSALSSPLIRLLAFSLRCLYGHWNNSPTSSPLSLHSLLVLLSTHFTNFFSLMLNLILLLLCQYPTVFYLAVSLTTPPPFSQVYQYCHSRPLSCLTFLLSSSLFLSLASSIDL